MPRPSYIVVSSVVVVLGIFGFITKYSSRWLPPPPPNRLEFETADYLTRAKHQAIAWRPLGPNVLNEAARTNKPILMVLGVSWSRQGRRADNEVFADMEVQTLLNNGFVCCRVDLTERPEMANAFLPLSRGGQDVNTGLPVDFDPAFQVWLLTPQGVLHSYVEAGIQGSPDSAFFLEQLSRQRQQLFRPPAGADPAGHQQASEASKLFAATPAEGEDFDAYTANLASIIDPTYGGLPTGSGIQMHRPQALLHFLETKRPDLFRAAADPVLRSPAFDWLDGGFFRRASSRDWKNLEYDKSAVQNAELLVAFARAGVEMKEPAYTKVAQMTFDSLADAFFSSGLLFAGRVGDERALGRSARSSMAASTVRRFLGETTLNSSEADWARTNLNLDPIENATMTIRLDNPRLAIQQGATFESIRTKLREAKTELQPQYSGRGYAEATCTVVARLLQAARIMGDPKRLETAKRLLSRLDGFRKGTEIRHARHNIAGSRPYVGDYLAYVDAKLEGYLTTGDRALLEEGKEILLSANATFRVMGTPLWSTWIGTPTYDFRDTHCPELVDNFNESCLARQIRLCWAYGKLMGDEGLVKLAQSSGEQAFRWAPVMGVGVAGVANAYWMVKFGAAPVVVDGR